MLRVHAMTRVHMRPLRRVRIVRVRIVRVSDSVPVICLMLLLCVLDVIRRYMCCFSHVACRMLVTLGGCFIIVLLRVCAYRMLYL